MYDIAVIGAGPAGLCAAIYAKRAGNSVIVFDQFMPGGQVMNTPDIENYPGFNLVGGVELAMKFSEHAASMGIIPEAEQVTGIERESATGIITVLCADKKTECRTVIAASGTKRRSLGVPGEARLSGRGVSYCACCDGSFFKGKHIALVGGGDTAVEDAIYLSRLCERVYLIHRRDSFRASKILTDRLVSIDNIDIMYDSVVQEINGEQSVSSISVKNIKTSASTVVPVSGVFIAIGLIPEASYLPDEIKRAQDGSVITDENCMTSMPGIYAAGDIRTKQLRQIVTAVSDGAIAAYSASKYIENQKEYKK